MGCVCGVEVEVLRTQGNHWFRGVCMHLLFLTCGTLGTPVSASGEGLHVHIGNSKARMLEPCTVVFCCRTPLWHVANGAVSQSNSLKGVPGAGAPPEKLGVQPGAPSGALVPTLSTTPPFLREQYPC